ncbi:N1221-like protein-domain-containing protein [Powellomyces hirtus]|nr:N1221-like protein-domain-containing protein [Powellomyces hirtus]
MPPTPPPPPFDPTAPLPTLEDVRAQLRKEGSPNLEPWDLDAPVSPGGVAATPPPVGRKTRDANELPHFGARRAANYDFIYADRDSFENELNEFYNFQDRPQIMEGKALFEATFKGQWKSAKPSYRGNYIGCLLEQMELRDPEPRYTAVRKLLYISQGVFGEVSTEAEHRQRIVENNQLIFQMGALDYVFAALKVVSLTLDAITRAGEPQIPPIERQFAMDLANSEITAYMCLLGLMIEVNSDDERFATEITNTNPPMASYLFTLVAQLAEGNRKHYPVKKLLLLLWKVLILSLGTTQQLTDLKSASRTLEGLPHFAEDSFVKSTPQDYHNFHLVAATRYPAYVTPNANSLCPPKLQLAEPIPTCIRRQLQQPAVLQPYINMDIVLPTTFQESVELYRKHNYVSLASVQIARERDRFEKEEEHKDVNGHSEMEEFVDALDDEAMSASHLGSERRRDQDATGLKRLENLYRHLLPQMSTHIGMLIRLLYYVNLGANNAAPLGSPDGNTPICEMTLDQKREHLMRADNNRHKEVVTKAVSGILLILLKALKCHHALKFEYVSQLLVDNNCAILILKMLSTWLQSPTAPPPSHPDIPNPTDAPGSSSWGEKPTTSKPPFNMGMGANWLMKKEEPAELE